MSYPKERRFRRYNLEFPVSLCSSEAGHMRELNTISKNVSTGGLLLRTTDQVPLHTIVNLTMQLQGPLYRRPIKLIAEGEVVRVERLGVKDGYAIAIECKHLITELENPLN